MAINILDLNNLETLKFLDWDHITSEISSHAYFEPTQKYLCAPPKFYGIRYIEKRINAISYFLEDKLEHIEASINQLRAVPYQEEYFKLPEHIPKGKIFTFKELNFLANLFSAHGELTRLLEQAPFKNRFDLEPSFKRTFRNKFLTPFRVFVDPKGEVDYSKHPELSKIFNDIVKIERAIRDRIRTISQSPLYKDALQYAEHDTINDHFVLAIRSDSYKAEQGPIVSRSSSGLTLFVSPPELSEKNSKRLFLLAELEEIISKICAQFSEVLHPFGREFKNIQDNLLYVDEVVAKAQYSLKKELYKPEITQHKELRLKSYFHPLIEEPVLNDIEIPKDKKGLLISGPNTGGKTVTLKSISINYLFLHLGMYVPAQRATLYPFQKIFYFSHDQQDLKSGLSSFASEAKNYLSLLEEIRNDEALILVDEIFNSTSSEEASALAIALIEEIFRISDSLIFISTHHQFLKAHVHERGQLLSCHVGFDSKTHLPTYKLNMGTPGGSMAFDIFENLCKSFNRHNQIGKRAQEVLESDKLNYETLINELIAKQSELDDVLKENHTIKMDLERKARQQQGLLVLEKEKILNEFNKKLNKILEEAESLAVEARKGAFGIKGIQRKTSSIQNKAKELNNPEKEKAHSRPSLSPDDIKEGDTVYSELLKKNVEVIGLRLKQKKAFIRSGNKSLWCGFDTLFKASHKKVSAPVIHVSRNIPDRVEYDCRGMRLEEFRDLIENLAFAVENEDIPYALIVHGHGDGVLKEHIRKRFSKNSKISCMPDEGNDGCSKLELKK